MPVAARDRIEVEFMPSGQSSDRIYTDGSYLQKTGGTWHVEDAPFKAQRILRMLARHPEVQPRSICEIGCGAGGILAELQKALPGDVTYTGYEISQQAHELSLQYSNPNCRFILGDAFADLASYDLVLVMDVVEHVEDCFAFLRQVRAKGKVKLFHIPLDIHAAGVMLGVDWTWDLYGHIHLFTIETALRTLEHSGHRVIDWVLTDVAFDSPNKPLRTRVSNLVRYPLGLLSPKLAARLVGGYSMLILAE